MPIQLAPNVVIAERFRLNRQLGRGGMGSVWHATHLGLDTACAVKFIEGENAQLPEAQARFEREAKSAAQLRSPHVVQILDHGVWQGTPYIAMELLDGEDLGKRLLRMGRLPPQEVLRIVTQVCRALTKAHSMHVVHRDLKPDNIFLVRDDDREIAKVLDFGIAKASGSGFEGSTTKTGAMLGTPYYMSPEQAQGTKAVDHRSDLWSLSVIVFQALTGKLPFESEALGDLLVKIIVTPIPLPSQFVADLPPGFDQWWARAAQRDPAGRFQSAKEFADSLVMVFGLSVGTDVMDRRPQTLPPPGALSPGGRFPSTPPPGGTVALAYQPPGGFPGSVPGMHAGTPQPVQGGTPRPYPPPDQAPTTGAPMSRTYGGPPPPPQGSRAGLIAGIAGGGLVLLVLAVVGVSLAMKGHGAAPPATAATTVTPPQVSATAAVSVAPPPTERLEPPPSSTAQAADAPDASPATSAATAGRPRPWVPPAGPAVTPPKPSAAAQSQKDYCKHHFTDPQCAGF
jgi:serine/threonine-protein kinase